MNEKTRAVLHSSKKDDWETPQWLFDALNQQYDFTFDLCASEDNAKLPRFCQDVQSGMLTDLNWADTIPIDWAKEVFFCNPPYGRQLPSVLSAIPNEARGVFLLPARTGSKWWHELVKKADWVYYIRGRLKFEGAEHSAPFDSALVGLNISASFHGVPDGYYHGKDIVFSHHIRGKNGKSF